MGKVKKRQSLRNSNHHDNPLRSKKTVSRRQYAHNTPTGANIKGSDKSALPKPKPNAVPSHERTKPRLPFSRWDRVLLIGDGDFSFALSLARHHEINEILATCFDTKEALEQKYPTVIKTIHNLCPFRSDDDRDTTSEGLDSGESTSEVWGGFSPTESVEADEDEDGFVTSDQPPVKAAVLYGIDATKLASVHKKMLRPYAPFTKIVFNFPHVGGLSTDVNRQVRSNQQLLVDFFNSAKVLLATASAPAKFANTAEEEDEMEYDDDIENARNEHLKHGQILVTLFEGEPYTLWNIRDLARHSGLKVLESFKFPWAAYPGYKHARTVGEITTGKDRVDEGKRKGAWRGEERDARCYILCLKDDDDGRPAPGSRKRNKNEDDSD